MQTHSKVLDLIYFNETKNFLTVNTLLIKKREKNLKLHSISRKIFYTMNINK
jgi:hypothetical protein